MGSWLFKHSCSRLFFYSLEFFHLEPIIQISQYFIALMVLIRLQFTIFFWYSLNMFALQLETLFRNSNLIKKNHSIFQLEGTFTFSDNKSKILASSTSSNQILLKIKNFLDSWFLMKENLQVLENWIYSQFLTIIQI